MPFFVQLQARDQLGRMASFPALTVKSLYFTSLAPIGKKMPTVCIAAGCSNQKDASALRVILLLDDQPEAKRRRKNWIACGRHRPNVKPEDFSVLHCLPSTFPSTFHSFLRRLSFLIRTWLSILHWVAVFFRECINSPCGTCVNADVIKKLYIHLVRPHLDYDTQVWSPHQAYLRNMIEAVQLVQLSSCSKASYHITIAY